MTLKRKHITFTEPLNDLIEQLAEKWGLDYSNTIRHCILVIAEQQGIAARRKIAAPKRKTFDAPR